MMAAASFLQTSFLGGRWSPYAQGRAEREDYKTALNECLNGLPIEIGAWARRSGTRRLGFTRNGAEGLLREFHFSETHPYVMEFTANHLRFWSGASLVTDGTEQTVVSISTANPAVVKTMQNHGWSTGDQVVFFRPTGATFSGLSTLFNRVLAITITGVKTFTLADAVTGATIDGSLLSLGNADFVTVARVLDIATLYDLPKLHAGLRVVQTDDTAFVLQATTPTYSLINTSSEIVGDVFAGFSFAPSAFIDGPYLDPPTDGSTMTPTGSGLSIVLNASSVNSINGGEGFLSTDVGRLVRLFSEPPAYAAGTHYTTGQVVKYANVYWQAVAASTGKQPDVSPNQWAIDPSGASWTWGTITAVTSGTQVSVTLAAADPAQILAGGALAYTTAIVTWQLGLFSGTTGYPSNGTYHEGRLWLSGVIGNRLDGSMSNLPLNFGPTLIDGTVADNCGISAIFNSEDVNTIFWMTPTHSGIICGTQAGEWLVQASQLNDPLTPTSIQAHRSTKYKCANVEPRTTGLSIVFVQNYGMKLYEYIADVYSGKFSGTNLSDKAKDLTTAGIKEIVYQYEKVPVVWCRIGDGSLIGVTYKRESPFGTQPASFSGWHRHTFGDSRVCEALTSGPSSDGTFDAVTLITNSPSDNLRHVELMTPLFDETSSLFDAWFVDDGHPPEAIDFDGTHLTLYGYQYAAGLTLDVWAAGLDLGSYVVSSTGTITLTIGTPATFTEAFLASIATLNYNDMGVVVRRTNQTVIGAIPDVTGILEFQPNSSPISGVSSDPLLAAWDAGSVFIFKQGNGATNGIRKFRMSNGSESADVASPTLLPSGGQFVQAPACIDNNGFIYFYSSSSNSGSLRKVGSDLTLAGTFGIDGNSGFITAPTVLAWPYSIAPLQADATHNYLVAVSKYGATQSGAEISVIHTDDMSLFTGNTLGRLVEFSGVACQGGHVSSGAYSIGTAFILGKREVSAPANDTPLNLYRVSANVPTHGSPTGDLTTVSSNITPQQVDATWTHWGANNGVAGLLYDGTDGNVIFSATTDVPANWAGGSTYAAHDVVRGSNGHDYSSKIASNVGNNPTTDGGVHWTDLGAAAYTQLSYLVKLNTHTGAVMWSFAIAGAPDDADNGMQNTRISYGRLVMLSPTPSSGSTYPLYYINTLTGASVSSQNVIGVGIAGPQAYDDHTSQLFSYGNYASGAGAPAPIGSTSTSFANQYWMFHGTSPAVPTNYFGPFVAGYTYASRGQLLRRIAPDETGARNGPALAKTRRTQRYGLYLANTGVGTGPATANGGGSINVGTVFNSLYPVQFRQADDITLVPVTSLYTGVLFDELQDDYSFDSMFAWEITRPYPATVLAVEQFLHTQDR